MTEITLATPTSKEEASAQLDFLANEAIWVRAIWKNCQMLNSLSVEDREMLGRIADTFFHVSEHALLHDVVSLLRRAADREKMNDKENVTLKGLVEAYQQLGPGDLAHALDTQATAKELDRFICHASKLKDARDDVFSHNERAVVLKKRQPPVIEVKRISSAIEALCKCLDLLNTAQCGGLLDWEEFGGNIDSLVSPIRALNGRATRPAR